MDKFESNTSLISRFFSKVTHASSYALCSCWLCNIAPLRAIKSTNRRFIDKLDDNQPLPSHVKPGIQPIDTPVIFNLATDWSELTPLVQSTEEWVQANATVAAARLAHLATVGWAPNQPALGCSLEYAICSDPESQKKYPQCVCPQPAQRITMLAVVVFLCSPHHHVCKAS